MSSLYNEYNSKNSEKDGIFFFHYESVIYY